MGKLNDDSDDEGAWQLRVVTTNNAQPQPQPQTSSNIEGQNANDRGRPGPSTPPPSPPPPAMNYPSSNMNKSDGDDEKDRDVDVKHDAIISFLSASEPGQGLDAEDTKTEALACLISASETPVGISSRSSSRSSDGGGVSGGNIIPGSATELSAASSITAAADREPTRRDSSATMDTAEAAMIVPTLTRHTARSLSVPGAQAIPGRGRPPPRLALASDTYQPATMMISELQQESDNHTVVIGDEPSSNMDGPEQTLETALVAQLADSERDVVARVTDRLESEMTERLQQEVAHALELERKRQVIVEAVRVSYSNSPQQPQQERESQRRERVCGLVPSKKCWLAVLVAVLLVLGGIVGVALLVWSNGDDAGGDADGLQIIFFF